jgi:site-specific DNA-methyltransferase (adenine-specific)
MINKAMLTSLDQDWNTPKELYNKLDQEFNFDFDPCPNDPDFDGLEVEWGKSNFINPPYTTSLQNAFIKKGLEESRKGKVCVFLIPARTGTKRFHNIILPYATEIRFMQDRLCFSDQGKRAPFDSMIVVFGTPRNNTQAQTSSESLNKGLNIKGNTSTALNINLMITR